MGNRNQLSWDIPAMDSYLVNQAIYEIPEEQFRKTVSEMTELLDLGDLLKKPVRGLSLGERMKCELAAALLRQSRPWQCYVRSVHPHRSAIRRRG